MCNYVLPCMLFFATSVATTVCYCVLLSCPAAVVTWYEAVDRAVETGRSTVVEWGTVALKLLWVSLSLDPILLYNNNSASHTSNNFQTSIRNMKVICSLINIAISYFTFFPF